jgi:hypothetical protein
MFSTIVHPTDLSEASIPHESVKLALPRQSDILAAIRSDDGIET